MTDRAPPLTPSAPPFSLDALRRLSDDALLAGVSALVDRSRRIEAALVAHIGEIEARGLYRREATPSMFAYCTEVLHLSECEAYLRIAAARVARGHPVVLEMLARGDLHLTAVAKLARILTIENRDVVLARAVHRSKGEIEQLVAEFRPRPDAPASVRRLPQPRARTSAATTRGAAVPAGAAVGADPPGPADSAVRVDSAALVDSVTRGDSAALDAATPVHPTVPVHAGLTATRAPVPSLRHKGRIEPLAPERYKVQFTVDRALRDRIDRLRALMPGDTLDQVLDRAITDTLARLEAKRFAKVRRPKGPSAARASADVQVRSRYVPAAVRREVCERDADRCRFVSAAGQRCRARTNLEFHHVHPFALDGARTAANIRLMCRAHNVFLAEHDFGTKRMAAYRRVREPSEARSLEPP